MTNIFVFLAIFFVTSSNAVSTKESSTYIAGVVEYNPSLLGNLYDMVGKNLAEYLNFISQAKKKNVDILVFPEATLNRGLLQGPAHIGIEVPHADEKALPCENKGNYSKILIEISCAAQLEEMYIVINVAEKAECNTTSHTNCSSNGTIHFNTNVVFDRNGVIVSRYRKIHLFGEKGFSPSLDGELGIFETDFGVTFGHFICFDILFQVPAVQIVEKHEIKNIIFPTMWFSELPFLTAVEIQEGYAHTHKVNLLAAGANRPRVGSTGSGIYSGTNGTLVSVMNGKTKSQLLVAEVPKIPNTLSSVNQTPKTSRTKYEEVANSPEVLDSLKLKRDVLEVYVTRPVDENKEHQFINLTHGNTECHFRISMAPTLFKTRANTSEHYRYRAVVYDGIRSFDGVDQGGVINCALVACTNDSLSTCGTRFHSYSSFRPKYEITSLEIAAMMPLPKKNTTFDSHEIVYHPVTLNTSIVGIGVSNYEFYKVTIEGSTDKQLVKMTLKKPQTELLTFGIFGRNFQAYGSSSCSNLPKNFVPFLVILCQLIVRKFM